MDNKGYFTSIAVLPIILAIFAILILKLSEIELVITSYLRGEVFLLSKLFEEEAERIDRINFAKQCFMISRNASFVEMKLEEKFGEKIRFFFQDLGNAFNISLSDHLGNYSELLFPNESIPLPTCE
ncbi:MAG: hypothetical protein QW507_02710 [Candidatus Nanoarchaeia archaeon]|nr:hypothetical protein [Candidatus Haiyanarchaeum thermophilum]MCW1303327.1 hypothetical protein [Candidatus Haiyanarchaeum thermophilum]MCW1304091.1 hypothetical protein [Candidatus Haiyanarchaeum thermophilum]MCW1306486.1 hypothetical protein [Candidatus Haiyanarchaeum thermophilum]MCW1307217.1 hypothetical protein [Candidatus Haiyanarchaeum thermophilum]